MKVSLALLVAALVCGGVREPSSSTRRASRVQSRSHAEGGRNDDS